MGLKTADEPPAASLSPSLLWWLENLETPPPPVLRWIWGPSLQSYMSGFWPAGTGAALRRSRKQAKHLASRWGAQCAPSLEDGPSERPSLTAEDFFCFCLDLLNIWTCRRRKPEKIYRKSPETKQTFQLNPDTKSLVAKKIKNVCLQKKRKKKNSLVTKTNKTKKSLVTKKKLQRKKSGKKEVW